MEDIWKIIEVLLILLKKAVFIIDLVIGAFMGYNDLKITNDLPHY
jgi:hypothetical protein